MTRIETDSLGQREHPDTALYGVNTLRGMENFDISPLAIGTEPAFVSALAAIKKRLPRLTAKSAKSARIIALQSLLPVTKSSPESITTSSLSTCWRDRAAPQLI